MNGRDRVLAFLAGQPVDRVPALPVVMQFCADHVGVLYGEYMRDHRVLAEAQVRTAEDYDLDCVSCMSDPAREATDCGAHVEFFPDQPAALVERDALLADKRRLLGLEAPDPLGGGRMHEAILGLALMKARAGDEKIVMGWVEGPCAQAANLRGLTALFLDFHDDPAFVRDLFAFVVDLELRYARAQAETGIDLIGIGDAAASLVGPRYYQQLVWPYEKQLVDGLHALGLPVRLHICGDTQKIAGGMGRLGCEIVDLDFLTPMSLGRSAMGPDQILLGNIYPVRALRDVPASAVRSGIAECHRQAGARYIVGAGCEVPRDTPRENVRAMIEYAREAGAA
jgi:MtaA/CmuA family methyltransferase